MPKTSKATAANVIDLGVLEERSEDLGGYLAGFTTFREDADATPVFKGLPDDRCQSHHWGYVFRGRSPSGTPTTTRSTRQATPTTPRRATSRSSRPTPRSSSSAPP